MNSILKNITDTKNIERMRKEVEKKFNIKGVPMGETLEGVKQRKLNSVDSWTAAKITNGIVSECTGYPVLYDTDRDTQYKLGLALGLVNAGVLQQEYPDGFPVRGYKQIEPGVFEKEKSEHYFTAKAVIQWNAEFGEHLKKCTAEGWEKQAEINACTTIEELDKVF